MEKVFTYKPRPVTIPGDTEMTETGFTGEIKIAIPDYTTRLKILKENMAQDGKEEAFDVVAGRMFETVKTYIKDIDFKHPDYEGDITTLDDLGYTDIGTAVIFDLGSMIMRGWSPNPKS